MMKMKMLFGLLCLFHFFLEVACADSTPDPNRIPGVVTKEDTSDLTVGIALGVGTLLLLVAFLIVLLINYVKKKRERNRETVVEHGEVNENSNGNNNADDKNQIPLHDVNTISVEDDVPINNENQTVVRENVDEVNSAMETSDVTNHVDRTDEPDNDEGNNRHSVAVTESEEPRYENNQGETNHRSAIVSSAVVGGAVVGGAGILGGASLLNTDDSEPDLQDRIEETIDNNEVIENAPQTLEEGISENNFVSNAFIVGSNSDSEREPSERGSERDVEDIDDADIPAPPPPSVDYLESMEHELADRAEDNEFTPDVEAREVVEDQVDSYNNTGSVHFDRELSDEEPALPSYPQETFSEQAASYSNQVSDQVQDSTKQATTTFNDRSQSESDYLRSLLPPPLDMDNIVIISKD